MWSLKLPAKRQPTQDAQTNLTVRVPIPELPAVAENVTFEVSCVFVNGMESRQVQATLTVKVQDPVNK